MNHDFICYIIISTIKIPYRLKNNFRYNYTVILYNIIFRFSFQIRRSDEHTPRAVGVRKYIIFLSQIPRCGFVTQRVFVYVGVGVSLVFVSFFPDLTCEHPRRPRPADVIASRFYSPFFHRFALFSRSQISRNKKEMVTEEPSSRVSRCPRASHNFPSFHPFISLFFSSLVCAESVL